MNLANYLLTCHHPTKAEVEEALDLLEIEHDGRMSLQEAMDAIVEHLRADDKDYCVISNNRELTRVCSSLFSRDQDLTVEA